MIGSERLHLCILTKVKVSARSGAGQTPLEGTLDDTEEDWQGKRMQEAAAVLGLLVKASLMLTPVDVDALKYICATAASLQVGNCAHVTFYSPNYGLVWCGVCQMPVVCIHETGWGLSRAGQKDMGACSPDKLAVPGHVRMQSSVVGGQSTAAQIEIVPPEMTVPPLKKPISFQRWSQNTCTIQKSAACCARLCNRGRVRGENVIWLHACPVALTGLCVHAFYGPSGVCRRVRSSILYKPHVLCVAFMLQLGKVQGEIGRSTTSLNPICNLFWAIASLSKYS